MNNETKYAYFAGFLDGEGTFTINKAYRKGASRFDFFVAIQCGMADCEENRIVLQSLKDEFGGYLKIYQYNDKARKQQRDLLFWRLTTKKAAHCAKSLLPYLVIKKKQALVLIDLADRQSLRNTKKGRPAKLSNDELEQRNNLVYQIRQLNLRGMAAKYRQIWAAETTKREDTENSEAIV